MEIVLNAIEKRLIDSTSDEVRGHIQAHTLWHFIRQSNLGVVELASKHLWCSPQPLYNWCNINKINNLKKISFLWTYEINKPRQVSSSIFDLDF